MPIALLSRCRGEAIEVDAERDGLRPAVRRSLPPPPAYLTHVVGTSWEHGRDVAVDDLDDSGGELRVRFDRDLADGEQDRVGVNHHTFLVEIEDSTGARERLPFDPDHPPRVEGARGRVHRPPRRADGVGTTRWHAQSRRATPSS